MSENSATETESVNKVDDSIESKISGQFNEEKWTRLTPKDVSISRFKILDDILEEVASESKEAYLQEESKNHLEEYPESVAARYFLGMLALNKNLPEEMVSLKTLLDQFQDYSKWAVVEYLSEKMLKVTENRTILRARAMALEKLGKTKEVTDLYEKLAKLDRKNPDIAMRYADAVVAEDKTKAVQFYKQAAEAYAKNHQYDKLKTVWGKLIENVPDDFAFYRKVERILTGYRQKEIIAELYTQLALLFIKLEDNERIIQISKKILEFNPNFTRFRNELIKAYREKYKDHSLLETVLEYSGLLSQKKSVNAAIQNFETNIVFDNGNYVFHRSWGVGKINEINSQRVIVDFADKEGHEMDLQLALKSLKPLKEDHFWVYKFEKREELDNLLKSDLVAFFKILISSFGNQITVNDIKSEIAGVFIPTKDWSKWWSKSRQEILKDNLIFVSPKKKDIIEIHETPVTPSERNIDKFQAAQGFEDKANTLVDALKDPGDNLEAIEYMLPFFRDSLKSHEIEVRIQSMLILGKIREELQDEDEYVAQDVLVSIKETLSGLGSDKVTDIVRTMKNQDLKKAFLEWLQENYEEWPAVYIELLLETPIKQHKMMLSALEEANKEDAISEFINRIRKSAKDNLEIYLWVFKNLITDALDAEKFLSENMIMTFFRHLKNIQKQETKGSKLKNTAKEILTGNSQSSLLEKIDKYAGESVHKIAGLVKDITFLGDAEISKFIDGLKEVRPSAFDGAEDSADEDKKADVFELLSSGENILTSFDAFERIKNELEHILRVEMPANSEEIGIAQEKGDLRENSEYKAALERQSILQAQVGRLEADIKKAVVIKAEAVHTDVVQPGIKVRLKDANTGDIFVYTIMDQWDADVDKGIISHRSPLGQALLRKKQGETTTFQGGSDKEMKLEILSIDKAVDNSGKML